MCTNLFSQVNDLLLFYCLYSVLEINDDDDDDRQFLCNLFNNKRYAKQLWIICTQNDV